MTTFGVLPEMVEPDLVIELETITAIYAGTLAGGFELLPGSVVHVAPHEVGVVMLELANPLKPFGAAPPVKELTFAHCEPQKVTLCPTAELLLPMTNEPPPPAA